MSRFSGLLMYPTKASHTSQDGALGAEAPAPFTRDDSERAMNAKARELAHAAREVMDPRLLAELNANNEAIRRLIVYVPLGPRARVVPRALAWVESPAIHHFLSE